ncbi:hypothetical protein D3C72_2203580 [compost metagenome]
MFGVGPGAAGTVETFGLICLEQCHRALRDDLLVRERFRNGFQCIPAAGWVIVFFNTFGPFFRHVGIPSILQIDDCRAR